MGELIYCKTPIAANPYYLEEASLNIYSLEEMSYFLYHNPYLVSATFMSGELCSWIGRELKEVELAGQLKEFLHQNVPLSIFVTKLLTANGYLSAAEIKQTVEQIASFENKSEAECRKLRADRLMEKHKVVDAIYEYEAVIQNPADLTEEVLGDTYHNLGTAYATMFFFPRAAGCYENAYLHNKKSASLKEMFYAIRCAGDEALYEQMLRKYHVQEEASQRLKNEVTQVVASTEVEEYQSRLNHLRQDYGEEEQYLARLGEQIVDWQRDYTRMSRI